MVSIIVGVAGLFMLLVSEPKAEIVCMLAKGMEACSFTANASGVVFNQKDTCVYLGGKTCENGSIEEEITPPSTTSAHLLPVKQPGDARSTGGAT